MAGNNGDEQYPEGKLNAEDEGEVSIAIGVEAGKVRIGFAHPTLWVAMGPHKAANFAELIIKHARAAALETGVVLTINI